MANYMFLYYKEKDDDTDKSMDEIMQDWGAWYQQLGDKLVDGGGPFKDNGMYVQKDESGKIEQSASVGYGIVKASGMDEAVELSKGCPMFMHNSTTTVRVYEVMPM